MIYNSSENCWDTISSEKIVSWMINEAVLDSNFCFEWKELIRYKLYG